MSKLLVVSGPFEDYHSTWVIDSKDVEEVKSIFGSNGWLNYEGDEVDELPKTLLNKIENILSREPKTLEDVYLYFELLSKDKDVTLEQFSKDVEMCICKDRGSWSSCVWVKV